MEINKKDIIQLLERIALYAEIYGDNPFKISAYRKAAQGLEFDERSLAQIDDFTKVSGIGKGTNEIITEFIQTNQSTVLADLEAKVPSGLIPLLKIPGLGGKRIARLLAELDVKDATDLQAVCENGELATLKGFGKKTVENILAGLAEHAKRPERLPVAYMLTLAHQIEDYLKKVPEIITFSLAGSLRRLRETIKDIDFIIATNEFEAVRAALLEMDHIKSVIASGDTKVSITLADEYDVNVDFRLVSEAEYATTLHHFTGSKEHNIKMRQLAKRRGEKINEYGVEVEATKEILQFTSESDFFKHFDLHYIPAEVRTGKGEDILFKENVPLITKEEIRGDLHMHTTYSDGAESVEEMVITARKKGYAYIAITDHSKFLRVANGLTEARLRQQREEINRLNEKYPDIQILAGVEMDILPDGSLDFDDDFLKEMDIVIAAIHSSFNQTEAEIMKRLNTALDNPYVDIIAHPTGRVIGRREGYQVDVAQLIDRAKETGTVLELNANPQRFDLATEWLARAAEAGVTLAINTDAHKSSQMDFMDYGVRRAKAAMLQAPMVLNTWDKAELMQFLNRNK